MVNKQPIQKFAKDQPANELSVHSIFYTIQGEGPFTGYPAIFIRLAGCNLQCPGCDTEYLTKEPNWTVDQIIDRISELLPSENKLPLIVITGGEPFRQNLKMLITTLDRLGFRIQIETNGTLRPFTDFDATDAHVFVICSPKTGKVNPHLLPFITAYKYVAKAVDICGIDGLPNVALEHSCKPKLARPHEGFTGAVYLQPMDQGSELLNLVNQDACIDSCMKHGHILQLQLHKILGME